MENTNSTDTRENNLLIGRRLNFIQQNTTTISGGQRFIQPGQGLKTALWLIGCAVLFVLILTIAILSKKDHTSAELAFPVIMVIIATPPTALYMYLLSRGVRYSNTLEKFIEANKLLISMRREAFTGIIGQLIGAYSEEFYADTLGTRNNNSESCWGANTISGRMVHVGRCYTTGPYSGFAHISVQLAVNQFPHIIIDADANNHNFTATNLARILGKEHEYRLEGNFPDYFKVFAANKETALVAYYVLTPDIMELLIQQIPTFDIEIVDSTIHMYWQDSALAAELNPNWANFLPRAYWLVEQVIAPIAERVEKYRRLESLGPIVQEKLVTNTAILADVARQIIYGKRQNALSATNKHTSVAVVVWLIFVTVVPFFLLILGIVIWVLIKPLFK